MAFDYNTLRNTVVEPLIDDTGKNGALIVAGPATGPGYDPQPWPDVTHAVRVVQTRFQKADNHGTLVEAGDVLFLMSTQGLTVDPKLANRIVVDDAVYQVVRIDPVKPGPLVMLWKVHARK